MAIVLIILVSIILGSSLDNLPRPMWIKLEAVLPAAEKQEEGLLPTSHANRPLNHSKKTL